MRSTSRQERIFRVNLPVNKAPIPGAIVDLAEEAIGRIFSLSKLDQVYAACQKGVGVRQFLASAQRVMGISCRVDEAELARVPKKGPALVVANHPFGGIEGIILAYWLLAVRPDVKIMANYMLSRIPELRDIFIFVDPFESREAVSNNLKPLREALAWVKSGGLLAVFPAGEVSSLKLKDRQVTDPAWSTVVARMARRAKATVVPSFFSGANGPLFQIAGLVHSRLRTAMLPREMLRKAKKEHLLRFGAAIPPKRLERFRSHDAATAYLRWRTYLLKEAIRQESGWQGRAAASGRAPAALAGGDHARAVREVAGLPPEATLVGSGDYRVISAYARDIPHLMKEVGHWREVTFRQVGEGTGRDLDLDRYDEHYLQLVLWNQAEQELVGAYRLGLADEILPRHGLEGLYTASLFRFEPEFFDRVAPAMEMGRSFVRDKYQRSFQALLLLWKGIGAFVVKNPQYRYIFGPVSVSSNYRPISRKLMLEFLQARFNSPFRKLVAPRTPVRFHSLRGLNHNYQARRLGSLDELNEIVTGIEGPGLGIPILIRQYLKLAARSAAWNLDPDFNDAMDCLLVSDLMDADAKTMAAYCTKEGYGAWRARHGSPSPAAAR